LKRGHGIHRALKAGAYCADLHALRLVTDIRQFFWDCSKQSFNSPH